MSTLNNFNPPKAISKSMNKTFYITEVEPSQEDNPYDLRGKIQFLLKYTYCGLGDSQMKSRNDDGSTNNNSSQINMRVKDLRSHSNTLEPITKNSDYSFNSYENSKQMNMFVQPPFASN